MYDYKLDVFVTVSQYLNFSAAANHLHIAQSAVSRNIAELEKELGVKVFERTRRGCTLTQAGEMLLEEAFKLISLSDSVKNKIVKISAGESGELVVGYPSELMIDPLLPCLQKVSKKYPNVDMHFLAINSLSAARMLQKGELEIAFGRKESFHMREEFEWRLIYVSPLHVVMPEDHPLAKEEKITLEMLEKETIILLSRASNPGLFDFINKMFQLKGMMPLMDTMVNDRHSSMLLVRLGRGVTLLSRQYMSIHKVPGVVTVPIDDENAKMEIGMAWNKDETNPVLKIFLDEVDMFLASQPNSAITI